jgi:hypothetical protein
MQISTRLSKEFNCLKEGTNIIKFKSKGRPPSVPPPAIFFSMQWVDEIVKSNINRRDRKERRGIPFNIQPGSRWPKIIVHRIVVLRLAFFISCQVIFPREFRAHAT